MQLQLIFELAHAGCPVKRERFPFPRLALAPANLLGGQSVEPTRLRLCLCISERLGGGRAGHCL